MIEISPYSPIPIYQQLISQFKKMISEEKLKQGDPLPPIRKLANQLGVANNTIARAYQEMEREGLIVSNGRKGSFVRVIKEKSKDYNSKIFKDTIIDLLQNGLGRKEIENIFHNNMNQIFN